MYLFWLMAHLERYVKRHFTKTTNSAYKIKLEKLSGENKQICFFFNCLAIKSNNLYDVRKKRQNKWKEVRKPYQQLFDICSELSTISFTQRQRKKNAHICIHVTYYNNKLSNVHFGLCYYRLIIRRLATSKNNDYHSVDFENETNINDILLQKNFTLHKSNENYFRKWKHYINPVHTEAIYIFFCVFCCCCCYCGWK